MASAGGMRVHNNETVSAFLPLVNSSTLTDSVKGNVGNVGVNLSAGIGNQQVNKQRVAGSPLIRGWPETERGPASQGAG